MSVIITPLTCIIIIQKNHTLSTLFEDTIYFGLIRIFQRWTFWTCSCLAQNLISFFAFILLALLIFITVIVFFAFFYSKDLIYFIIIKRNISYRKESRETDLTLPERVLLLLGEYLLVWIVENNAQDKHHESYQFDKVQVKGYSNALMS
jgi:hypothetical protein